MSRRRLELAIAALALAGLGIAGYLTYVHYAGIKPLCLASGGCEKVQSSQYGKLAGVPVAVLGVLGYSGVLVSLLAPGDTGRATTACLALIGVGFSGYLTYRELFTIDSICQWCVASAAVMTAIAALAVFRLLRADPGG
jgi:uncharacterized membrane protein